MRLLNVKTLDFEYFFDEQTPPYAVVSHRWGEKEVSFQDYLAGRNKDGPGHAKIVRCCQITQARGLQHCWIDTCCIDKSSSAELTEAINSMYRWYEKAVECYAILPDVPHELSQQETHSHLRKSVWFTRGWTLQELLAPSIVHFYDARFSLIASKAELAPLLFEITGIRENFLTNPSSIREACIAEKMSWAANRQTTRLEDMAYCLLGLFGVNMPLLYGERDQAFFRLQLEIIRSQDDESIYAWKILSSEKNVSGGMLAPSPSAFANSGNVRKLSVRPEDRVPWNWTGKGLEIRLVEARMSNPMFGAGGGGNWEDPMPMGQGNKLVTLGCWLNESGEEEGDPDEVKATNLCLNLKRKGNCWRRMGVEAFNTCHGFQYVTRMSNSKLILRHYYVPQWAEGDGKGKEME